MIVLQLSGAEYGSAAVAIGPPARATHAVNWRSNVGPVGLGKWLLFDILRQLASDRGGSGRIGGSLVHLVVDRRVSGHRINGSLSFLTVLGPRISGP